MASYTILHNPRCTKSRNSIKLLESNGISFEIREYLDDPLSVKELKDLMTIADFELKDLVHPAEAKEAGVDIKNDDLIKAIAKYPKIMQRPVVIKGKKAVIARDEAWLKQL
jgi:arsenate reductase (glutaredoxin)